MKTFIQYIQENAEKWSYINSGYITPSGKTINGNHDRVAKSLGFKNHKEPIGKGYARFLITTGGEAVYQFNHHMNPEMLNHVMKHASENEHHIQKLHLDSGHYQVDSIGNEYKHPGGPDKISLVHRKIKNWLDN